MPSLVKPSRDTIQRFLAAQRGKDFTYPGPGATSSGPPAGYTVDHHRQRLGHGAPTFERAVKAMRRWAMFDLGWVELCWPDAPIQPDTTVAVLARAGLWWLNACRIVYVLDEQQPIRRFGFAYGTLADHAEQGEERFLIEWNPGDDSVWYDILAYSRPRHPLAWIGLPVARAMQRRFARDSQRAMVRAVQAGG